MRERGIIDVIDWELVGDDYYGIEITHPYGEIGSWISTWDISSGCVWNPRAIESVEKLY